MSNRSMLLSVFFIALAPASARAEVELSLYGGLQSAPHSSVTITGTDFLNDQQFTASWDGNSFMAPPYYGLRAIWWHSSDFGIGMELNHAKVYADDTTLKESGLSRLEFSDGLNILTLNIFRRWPEFHKLFVPYFGGGIGLSIPHVEVTRSNSKTFEYQITGPAVAVVAGVSYPIADRWSVFAEYKGTYSINKADLESGNLLETNIVTNAVNFGVSFDF